MEVTREKDISRRADCVVAVDAEKAAMHLSTKLKKAIQNSHAQITFALGVDGKTFIARGVGNPGLLLSHPTDMVTRKSMFVCNRTLMVKSNKASIDIPGSIVKCLQDSKNKVEISICVEI